MSHRRTASPISSDHSRDSRVGGSRPWPRDGGGARHDRRASQDPARRPATLANAHSGGPPATNRTMPGTISSKSSSSSGSAGSSAVRRELVASGSHARSNSLDASLKLDPDASRELFKALSVFFRRQDEGRQLEEKLKTAKEWMRKNPGRSDYDEKLRKMEDDLSRLVDAAKEAESAASEALEKLISSAVGSLGDRMQAVVDALCSASDGNQAELKRIMDGLQGACKTSDHAVTEIGRLRDIMAREKVVQTAEQNAVVARLRDLEALNLNSRLRDLERAAEVRSAAPPPLPSSTLGKQESELVQRLKAQVEELASRNARLEETTSARIASLEATNSAQTAMFAERLAALESRIAPGTAAASAVPPGPSPPQPARTVPSNEAPPPPPPSQPPPPLPSQPPPPSTPAAVEPDFSGAQDQTTSGADAAGGPARTADVQEGAEGARPLPNKRSRAREVLDGLERRQRTIEEEVQVLQDRLDSIEGEVIPSAISHQQEEVKAQLQEQLQEQLPEAIEDFCETKRQERRKRRRIDQEAAIEGEGGPAPRPEANAAAAVAADADGDADMADAPTKDAEAALGSSKEGPAAPAAKASAPGAASEGKAIDPSFKHLEIRPAMIEQACSAALAHIKQQATSDQALADLTPRILADVMPKVKVELQAQLATHLADLVGRAEMLEAIKSEVGDLPTQVEASLLASIEQRFDQLIFRPETVTQLVERLRQAGTAITADVDARLSAMNETLRGAHIGFRDKVKEKLMAFEARLTKVDEKLSAFEAQLAKEAKRIGRLDMQASTQAALFAKFIQEVDPYLAHGPEVLDRVVLGVHQAANNAAAATAASNAGQPQQQQPRPQQLSRPPQPQPRPPQPQPRPPQQMQPSPRPPQQSPPQHPLPPQSLSPQQQQQQQQQDIYLQIRRQQMQQQIQQQINNINLQYQQQLREHQGNPQQQALIQARLAQQMQRLQALHGGLPSPPQAHGQASPGLPLGTLTLSNGRPSPLGLGTVPLPQTISPVALSPPPQHQQQQQQASHAHPLPQRPPQQFQRPIPNQHQQQHQHQHQAQQPQERQ